MPFACVKCHVTCTLVMDLWLITAHPAMQLIILFYKEEILVFAVQVINT